MLWYTLRFMGMLMEVQGESLQVVLSSARQQIESRLSAGSSQDFSEQTADAQFADDDVHKFVTNAYKQILRRDPDPGGYRYYVDVLRTRRLDKAQIIAALLSSEEARARRVRIAGLGWVLSEVPKMLDEMREGASITCDVADREGATDEEFVADLYRKILRREPNPEGASLWLELLRSGSLTRREAVVCFLKTGEAQESQTLVKDLVQTGNRMDAIVGSLASIQRQVDNLFVLARLDAHVMEMHLLSDDN
jgi:hypothetical protein